MTPEYCDAHRNANVRATHSVDDIPVDIDGDKLAVGVLYFCRHHTAKFESTFAAKGYSVNVHDEKYLAYLENQNRLIGSEN